MAGRRWTEAEDQTLISRYNGETAEAIGKRLGRTTSAVHLRALKLSIDRSIPGQMSMHAVCDVLGMEGQHQMVKRWIAAGMLKARRGPDRGRVTPWVIMDEDLIAFLRQYPWMVDRSDVHPPYRAELTDGRWITLVEAFRRGAAFPTLLENGCKAGLIPEAKKRILVWMIPESILPRLIEGRKRWTDDALHRRQKAMYTRLQTRHALKDRKKEILKLRSKPAANVPMTKAS